MKLLNAREMKDIDTRASREYGIPSIVLMENAGIRTVEVIEELLVTPAGKHIVILAGRGNNGGDGLVIARHLVNSGAQVDTFLLGTVSDLTADARVNFNILSNMKAGIFPLLAEADLDKLLLSLLSCDLIVDSIYGIGFKGSLNVLESRVAQMVNWSRRPVVAVDIPSGVEADTGAVHGEAIQANHTVTFALPKIGLVLEPGKEYVGTLSVADISIPLPLLRDASIRTNLINEALIAPLIRPRFSESHKGTYGHALIVGGSRGMTGAVVMTAVGALKSGSGLVTAAVPESLLPVVDGSVLEVMTTPLAQTRQGTIALEALPALENLLGTVSVCAIGPGMSRYEEARAVISHVLERSGVPVVIDADGLNALQGEVEVLRGRQVPVVITPHPGEMARLIGKSVEEVQADRINIARQTAEEWGVTVVLKGNKTVIATPQGEVYVNITGNPGMATAGSGDVLCGMITGLIAQGLKPHQAAFAGVFLHGRAGDLAAQARGQRGMVAGDLLAALPDVLRGLETSRANMGEE